MAKKKTEEVPQKPPREEVEISYDQPIECAFADVSERLMRIQRDLLMPALIFEREKIQNTITFFGSARVRPEAETKAEYAELKKKKLKTREHLEKLEAAKMAVEMSKYYTASQELARRLQEWTNMLNLPAEEKYYIMTGGGPGLMESANKGAYQAGGKTVGATIFIADEQRRNEYVDRGVWMNFNYFLMRKFWLLFFAKAVIVFPGGTGTFDEFFEVLTLVKTRKAQHDLPMILFGKKFWNRVVDFEYLVKADVITRHDLNLFRIVDTVEEAFEFITSELNRTRKAAMKTCAARAKK